MTAAKRSENQGEMAGFCGNEEEVLTLTATDCRECEAETHTVRNVVTVTNRL
jgi:hypothetical protein